MTQNPRFDALVFIGRFQPVHLGHLKVFEEGLKQASRLYVLIGSTEQPRNLRNPFTFEERKSMVEGCVSDPSRIRIIALPDIAYNDQAWIKCAQEIVERQLCNDGLDPCQARVGLIGHEKDASSYYLGLFPQWRSVGVEPYKRLGATELRDTYLRTGQFDPRCLPQTTVKFLEGFLTQSEYKNLAQERAFIDTYRQGWQSSPYPPIFVSVDGVVIQSGHVLLVRRRTFPGRGLIALPGGFVNVGEHLVDAMLRELREETQLNVRQSVLKGAIRASRVFDDPHRSARGRTITHAYLIQLTPQADGLPQVQGGDDADKAFWLPLANLDSYKMFEDHYHIIHAMVSMAQ